MDAKVAAYLERLEQALAGLDPAEREEFLREIRDHITDALAQADPALPAAQQVDAVLRRLGAPERYGRMLVYQQLLWLGWQKQSLRLLIKAVLLALATALGYLALCAVGAATVLSSFTLLLMAGHRLGMRNTVFFNGRDVTDSWAGAATALLIAGLGWVLLWREGRLIRGLQRTVARWADRLPDTVRIPLPIPPQGVTWWLLQVFQALGFAAVFLVLLNLLLLAGAWAYAIVTNQAFSGLLPGPWLPVAGVRADPEGVSVQLQWGAWLLCALAGAGHLLWRWQQVRRAGTAAS